MQYVNDGLVAGRAGAEHLQEFDRLIRTAVSSALS